LLENKKSDAKTATKILVVGVGGAGINMINRMIDEKLEGVEFFAIDTDKQCLQFCKAPKLLLIGEQFAKGMGKEPYPEIGKRAARERLEEISEVLMGFDVVFIVCGMGGSTGTGAVKNDHCVKRHRKD
jgi:cell division protein FtsZ